MLAFEAVTKDFADIRAVDELSFELAAGEVFALLGPNGAGKTTSVRIIMGLIQPDSGEIRFAPALLRRGGPDRRRLGYLPEERGLYQEATVLSSLLYLAALRGCRGSEARRRALGWLERVELSGRADDKVSSLSKGNQQKVQFIASILHAPRLAVLDEPFSGLDPINQERMCGWIRELRDQGATVLLSAHQLQLVEQIADRILLLHLCRRHDDVRQGAQPGRNVVLVSARLRHPRGSSPARPVVRRVRGRLIFPIRSGKKVGGS